MADVTLNPEDSRRAFERAARLISAHEGSTGTFAAELQLIINQILETTSDLTEAISEFAHLAHALTVYGALGRGLLRSESAGEIDLLTSVDEVVEQWQDFLGSLSSLETNPEPEQPPDSDDPERPL